MTQAGLFLDECWREARVDMRFRLWRWATPVLRAFGAEDTANMLLVRCMMLQTELIGDTLREMSDHAAWKAGRIFPGQAPALAEELAALFKAQGTDPGRLSLHGPTAMQFLEALALLERTGAWDASFRVLAWSPMFPLAGLAVCLLAVHLELERGPGAYWWLFALSFALVIGGLLAVEFYVRLRNWAVYCLCCAAAVRLGPPDAAGQTGPQNDTP